jgi:hypothetical protein
MDNRRFRSCEQVFAISEFVIWKWTGQRVRPAPPAGPLCGSSAPPTDGLVRPEEGATRDKLARSAAWHAFSGGLAGQRCIPPGGPLTCCVTAWRAIICRIYVPPGDAFPTGLPRVSGRGPCVSARRVPGVSRPECRGVSAGVAWRFRRGSVAFPPGWRGVSAGVARRSGRRRVRAAARSRRGCPSGPGAEAQPPASSQACDPFPDGRPAAGLIQQYARPAVSR